MRAMLENRQESAQPNFGWVRVLLAAVAVHVVGVVVSVASIVAYSVVTTGGSVEGFAGALSTWILPVLTLPAAVWVAHGARRETAAANGFLVGLLVAGLLGLLFFLPNDLRSLALFALIAASGLAGGLIGGAFSSRRWRARNYDVDP